MKDRLTEQMSTMEMALTIAEQAVYPDPYTFEDGRPLRTCELKEIIAYLQLWIELDEARNAREESDC